MCSLAGVACTAQSSQLEPTQGSERTRPLTTRQDKTIDSAPENQPASSIKPKTIVSADSTTQARPLPSFFAQSDIDVVDTVAGYQRALQLHPSSSHTPYAPGPFALEQSVMEAFQDGTSYVVSPPTTNLLDLADLALQGPNIAAFCERHIAGIQGIDAQVFPDIEQNQRTLIDTCNALGTVLPRKEISGLRTIDFDIVSLDDCSYPSGVYGSHRRRLSGSTDFGYTRDNITATTPKQSCQAVVLTVEAMDHSGSVVDTGRMLTKMVPDFNKLSFPFLEHDSEFGTLRSYDGRPRSEFTIVRWLFDRGVSMYLGKTPLWFVPSHRLEDMQIAELLAGATGEIRQCPFDYQTADDYCIISRAQAFLFPSSPEGFWTRQFLDGTHPRYNPDLFSFERSRNPFELNTVSNNDSLTSTMRYLIDLFGNLSDDATNNKDQLLHMTSQINSAWYSLQLYRGAFTGFEQTERNRGAVVDDASGGLLIVPNQGYAQLGTLDQDALAKAKNLVQQLNSSN